MKRFLKALTTLSLILVMVISLTSCGYNFYNDWHSAGADIEKENIYVVITLEEAKKMKEEGQKFALIYASSSSSTSVDVITTFQIQAEYLGNEDAKIYFIDSSNYQAKEKRNEVRDAIKMHEAPSNGSPVVMTFKNGAVDVDTSNVNKVKTKEFIVDGDIKYSSLASYIFKELLAE